MKFPFIYLFEANTKEEAQAKAEGWSHSHLKLHQATGWLLLLLCSITVAMMIRGYRLEVRVQRLEDVAPVASK